MVLLGMVVLCIILQHFSIWSSFCTGDVTTYGEDVLEEKCVWQLVSSKKLFLVKHFQPMTGIIYNRKEKTLNVSHIELISRLKSDEISKGSHK